MPSPRRSSDDKTANQRTDSVSTVNGIEIERHQIATLVEEVTDVTVSLRIALLPIVLDKLYIQIIHGGNAYSLDFEEQKD